jgi:alkylation response protein AidB-like acyl-CoA dehydrogenase
MDFRLNEEQEMLRQMVRDFADKELKPFAHEADEREHMSPDAVRKMAELGLMGMTIPEEYGGLPMDSISITVALEEVGRACGGTGLALEAHTCLGVLPIVRWGTPEVKERFLPRLAAGQSFGCLALTEPDAGSDLAGARTTAVEDGDSWVINGTKAWITNASIADSIVVFLRTDPDQGTRAFSLIVVETDRPGLTIGPKEKKMGVRASPAHALTFEDVRVPKGNLLGQRGRGLQQTMAILDSGRVGVSALAVGLADMATEIQAGRLLLRHAAWLEDQGERFTIPASMTKLYASEMAERVAYKAVQIHGGYGYSKEYAVERIYRDARLLTIGEGTSEVQRMVIGRSVAQA